MRAAHGRPQGDAVPRSPLDEARAAKKRLENALHMFEKAVGHADVEVKVADVLHRLLGFTAYLTVVAALVGGTLYKEYFEWVLPGGRLQLSLPEVIELAAREPLVLATIVLPLLLLAPVFLFSWLHPARKQFVELARACTAATQATDRLCRQGPLEGDAAEVCAEVRALIARTHDPVKVAHARGWDSILDDVTSRSRPVYLLVGGAAAVYILWRAFSIEALDLLARLPNPSTTLEVLTFAVAGLVAVLFIWYARTVDVVQLRYKPPTSYLAVALATVIGVTALAQMLTGEGKWWGYNTVSKLNAAYHDQSNRDEGVERSYVELGLDDSSTVTGYLVWVSSSDTYVLVHENDRHASDSARNEMKGVRIPNGRIASVTGNQRNTWTHITDEKKRNIRPHEVWKAIVPWKWVWEPQMPVERPADP